MSSFFLKEGKKVTNIPINHGSHDDHPGVKVETNYSDERKTYHMHSLYGNNAFYMIHFQEILIKEVKVCVPFFLVISRRVQHMQKGISWCGRKGSHRQTSHVIREEGDK